MSAASVIASSDVDIERALLSGPGRAEEEESKVEPPAASEPVAEPKPEQVPVILDEDKRGIIPDDDEDRRGKLTKPSIVQKPDVKSGNGNGTKR